MKRKYTDLTCAAGNSPASPPAKIIGLVLVMSLGVFTVGCSAGSGSDPSDPSGQGDGSAGQVDQSARPTTVTRGGEPIDTAVPSDVGLSSEEPNPPGDADPVLDPDAPNSHPRRSAPIPLGSPEYAVQAFLWWRPENAERDLLLADGMGFGWVKQIFGWRDIEPEKGNFDWSKTDFIVDTTLRYGDVHLIARLDFQPDWARSGCTDQGPPTNMQDYADYVGAVAHRYRGQIGAYQIWNEPNLAREWCDRTPSPEAYAEMLRVAYGAIKAADPTAYVISAGLSPTGSGPPQAMPDDTYLDQLYQAMGGSSDGYFDIMGVHAAGFAAPPEISPAEAASNPAYGGERFFTFRRVEDLRAIQERYGDGDKRVAVLEMGWTSDRVNPSYAWHAVSEETKADYLVRAYEFAAENWSPWISVMSTIYLCDADWTTSHEQYWWCINNPDGTPRAAFDALSSMQKVGAAPR